MSNTELFQALLAACSSLREAEASCISPSAELSAAIDAALSSVHIAIFEAARHENSRPASV